LTKAISVIAMSFLPILVVVLVYVHGESKNEIIREDEKQLSYDEEKIRDRISVYEELKEKNNILSKNVNEYLMSDFSGIPSAKIGSIFIYDSLGRNIYNYTADKDYFKWLGGTEPGEIYEYINKHSYTESEPGYEQKKSIGTYKGFHIIGVKSSKLKITVAVVVKHTEDANKISSLKKFEIVSVIAIGLGMFLCMAIAGISLKPLGKITKAVRAFSSGKVEDMPKIKQNDELKELIRSIEALINSYRNFSFVTQLAKIGYWEWNNNEDYIRTNKSMNDIYGIQANKELSYNTILEYVHPEEKELFKSSIQKALDGEKTNYIKYRIVLPNGTIRHLETMFAVSKNINNENKVLTGINIDVTEQIMKRDEILSLITFKDKMLDSILVWINMFDENNNVTMWNKAAENISGYKKEDTIGNSKILELLYPDEEYRKNIILKTKDVLENNKDVKDYETIINCKNGDQKIISWNLNKMYDEKGEKAGLLTLGFDITQKKEAEKVLRQLTLAVEQSPISIIIINKEGIIEYANPKFFELYEYDSSEITGKQYNELNIADITPMEFTAISETVNSGNIYRTELLNHKKSGTEFKALLTITPIVDADEKTSHYLIMCEDITEKKLHEEEMEKALIEAEEANKLKSVLLANMSHELRTPMNGIIGFASLIKTESREIEIAKMAEKIHESSKRLMHTFDSILQLAELESGSVRYTPGILDFVEYTKKLLGPYETKAGIKNIKLVYEASDENISCLADEELYKRIFGNLIDNAIKFTSKGYIKVEVGSIEEGDKLYAVVKVSDSGIGIKPEYFTEIFKEFRQLSEGFSRRYEGNGLGLTVAKKTAELLGGSISVESVYGEGAVFTLKLIGIKVKTENGVAHNKSAFPENQKYTMNKPPILLVEDNVVNQEIINIYLYKNYLVDCATDGTAALIKANSKKYAAILMDINLGHGMDGITTSKEIKKNTINSNTPIIAVTGYTPTSISQEFRKNICEEYILKPFLKAEILALLNRVIEKTDKQKSNNNYSAEKE